MLGFLFILLQFVVISLACVYICVMIVTEQKFNKQNELTAHQVHQSHILYVFQSRFLELFHITMAVTKF